MEHNTQTEKRLLLNGRDIILIGTAHISRESVEQVEESIRRESPAVVAIELDDERLKTVRNPDSWKNLDVVKVLREGKGLVLLANLVLASFQRRMGATIGISPGAEMAAAINTAESLGIPCIMVDRPIQVTLRRAWGKNSLWGKCKLLSALLSAAFSTETVSQEEIEALKNSNEMDNMMGELATYLPSVKSVLIDERDQYLGSRIWQCEGQKVLAVLGAGHLPGVVAHLGCLAAGEESPDTAAIETLPPPSLGGKILGWVFPLLIVGLIAAGFLRGGAGMSADMLIRWFLLNGSLAALATVVAGGHVLSVIASFVCAPLGTLSPVLSVGVFSGVVQAWVKKPKVEDMAAIQDDLTSLKGIYRNRILRVLLVFLLSSLGGAIGNFIALPSLFMRLGQQ
jgi:pheromone shutdown-related protein TraB